MPHRTDQDDIIFHNGSPGLKKKRRPSFWGCRPRKATSSARAHQSGRQTRAKFTEPSSSTEIISDRNSLAAARQHSNPAPSRRQRPAVGHNTMDGGIDRPVYWESPMRPQGYRSPRSPSRTRAQWPVMQPFRALIALVKRCPWAVGSDLASRDPAFSDDAYYPSVPRSLLHDTAVSFVVKDHTQSDLPEFVVSCPFEHVDKVHQLLAPDGSHRQLNARGTSGQPRAGDQLRSMLLDGTPSIELTLHPDTGRGVGGRSDNQTRPASDPWNDGAATGPTPNYGGRGWDSGYPQTSPAVEPAGVPKLPLINQSETVPAVHEPKFTHLIAMDDPASPLSKPQTSPKHSHVSPVSKHMGQERQPLQATVETAPPSPAMEPVRLDQEEHAATAAEMKLDQGRDDPEKGQRDAGQGMPAGEREPPAICYLQPSPEQVQRGEPLRGWLCEPEWFRRRVRDLTRTDL